MKIEIKKAKFFYSQELNQKKFDAILNKAVKIRDFKNKISNEIYKNLLKYLDKSKFDVIKEFNQQIDDLNGQDIQNAISDVWISYENMMDKIKKELSFKRKNRKSTKLQMILSFLSKYGYYGISSQMKIPENDKKKAIFFQEIKDYCQKYGENRLIDLALKRRTRIIKRKSKLIQFNQLSFRTITRINSNIFDFNKNFLSKFNGFVNMGGYSDYKKLSIPTKFNKSYHGDKSKYHRNLEKPNSQSYQIKIIDEKKKIVRIAHLIDDSKEIPTENVDYLGVDINVKHNLFSTEVGNIDYDRDLINKYVKFLQKIDNKKVKLLNKRRSSDYQRWRLKIKNHIKGKMVELLRLARKNGRNHLILEELSVLGKMKSNSEFGINYGRLFRLLGLTSIKNEIENIAHNHGFSISFVQPEYSSQTCCICGHISKENRQNQEEFCCVLCNHQDNADQNSSKNLQYRIISDVLRKSLLEMNDYNEWRPKKSLTRDFIRASIFNSYKIANEKQRSES